MCGIIIPLQDFALKMQGGLMREGGSVFVGHYGTSVTQIRDFNRYPDNRLFMADIGRYR